MMLTGSPGARWIKIKLIVNTIKMVIIPVKKRRRIYLFNVLTEQCLHLPPLGVKMEESLYSFQLLWESHPQNAEQLHRVYFI